MSVWLSCTVVNTWGAKGCTRRAQLTGAQHITRRNPPLLAFCPCPRHRRFLTAAARTRSCGPFPPHARTLLPPPATHRPTSESPGFAPHPRPPRRHPRRCSRIAPVARHPKPWLRLASQLASRLRLSRVVAHLKQLGTQLERPSCTNIKGLLIPTESRAYLFRPGSCSNIPTGLRGASSAALAWAGYPPCFRC
jgi:hypothetical protein